MFPHNTSCQCFDRVLRSGCTGYTGLFNMKTTTCLMCDASLPQVDMTTEVYFHFRTETTAYMSALRHKLLGYVKSLRNLKLIFFFLSNVNQNEPWLLRFHTHFRTYNLALLDYLLTWMWSSGLCHFFLSLFTMVRINHSNSRLFVCLFVFVCLFKILISFIYFYFF